MTGEKLGPYEILASIGSGGMGEVWKARDTRLGRIVAIKKVKEQHSERFKQEARSIAALNHPNICQIHDIGPDYLVLEYVEGKPLSSPLPEQEAVRLAIQIATALEAAHKKGIIHRDLKPANIMVTEEGVVKLLDFGLAKLYEQDQSNLPTADFQATQAGAILGTVAYMSPEQAQGQTVDARSDIFSFGLVLYEMLSGRRAFSGNSASETIAALLRDEPAPLKADPAIERIVERCLEKDPADRYASAVDITSDLRQLELVGRKPNRNWSRREWIRACSIFALLLVLMGVLGIWTRRPYQPKAAALDWYQKGMQSLHSMTFDSARKAFEQAVEIDTQFALAHACLAISYDSLDYSELAAKSMLRAIAAAQETRLSSIDQMRLRAMQYMVSRDYDKAVPLLQKIENDVDVPKKADAALESGWLAEKRDDTKGAAAAYERALILDPIYAAARLRLGFIQQRQGKDIQAIQSFSEAENLYNAESDFEGVTETLYQRANLLNRRSRGADAMPFIEKALNIANTLGNRYQEIRIQLLQSAAFRQLGEQEPARQLAEEAIDAAILANMDNLATSGLITLGSVLSNSGDFESAEQYYRRALDVAQEGKVERYKALASLALGALFEQKNQPEEAKRFAEVAEPFYRRAGYRREILQVMAIRGRSLHQLGEFEQGVKILRETLAGAIQFEDQVLELGIRGRLVESLQEEGDWPEALQESEKAVSMPITGIEIAYGHLGCAGLYWRLGLRQEAERSLSQVERMLLKKEDPQFLSILRFREAEISYAYGHLEKAKAKARMAVLAMPTVCDWTEPDAKLIEALVSIRTGLPSEGIQSALEIIQQFDQSKLAYKAASARLSMAEALSDINERSLAHTLALDALDFFEQHKIWESAWRAHLVLMRVSSQSAEEEAHRESARNALVQMSKSWPEKSLDGYRQRPDIRLLSGGISLE